MKPGRVIIAELSLSLLLLYPGNGRSQHDSADCCCFYWVLFGYHFGYYSYRSTQQTGRIQKTESVTYQHMQHRTLYRETGFLGLRIKRSWVRIPPGSPNKGTTLHGWCFCLSAWGRKEQIITHCQPRTAKRGDMSCCIVRLSLPYSSSENPGC